MIIGIRTDYMDTWIIKIGTGHMDRRVQVNQNNFRRKKAVGGKENTKVILLAAELLKSSLANFGIGSMSGLTTPPSCMAQEVAQPHTDSTACSGGCNSCSTQSPQSK